MSTIIKRDLPNDEYQAAINSNNASSSNVFATMADLVSGITVADKIAFDAKYDESEGISKGQAVYVSGADGTNITVKRADYSVESTSSKTLGLAAESGALNHQGQVISEGLLSGINTSAANAVGDPVWLGDNGDLIYGLVNKPYAPNHLVFIGIVTKKNASTGEIFVKVQNGFELDELHNVDLKTSTPTNGQVLVFDSVLGVWKNQTLVFGLSYFTEAQNTTAPNATVPVDSLTAVSAATNTDIAIRPKGTGALTLAIPDGTATGGDKRGTNAVDLQIARTNTNQVASGANSAILGSGNRAYGANSVAVGTSSVAGGGGNATALGFGASATGNNSLAMQQGSATGTNSIAFGTRAKATNQDSLAMGGYTYIDTTASGQYSTAISGGNTASGDFSMAWGGYGNLANGGFSYAAGRGAYTFNVTGRQSRGYYNTVGGDCQRSEFFLSKRTTDAIASILTVDGGGVASTTNQVILSNQSAYAFEGKIIGKQSGSTNVAMWKVEGIIVRGANAASTVLTASTVTLFSNLPGWGTPTLAADTTNGGLQIQVSGLAATNIQWTAVINTTEVIYA